MFHLPRVIREPSSTWNFRFGRGQGGPPPAGSVYESPAAATDTAVRKAVLTKTTQGPFLSLCLSVKLLRNVGVH